MLYYSPFDITCAALVLPALLLRFMLIARGRRR